MGFRLLALAALLVLMATCNPAWLWECTTSSDCDDGNPCTSDFCEANPETSCDRSWCDDCVAYYCMRWAVPDRTECEVDGHTGVCESGECRLEGETADGGA